MNAFREEIQAMAEGRSPMAPFDQLVGLGIDNLARGRAVLRVQVDERFHNPARVVHGGVLSGLVDSAMAYAVAGELGPKETCTNVDLTIRFLRGILQDTLVAEAQILRAGRTVIVASCLVKNSSGELVASASSTFLRLAASSGPGWLSKPGA